MKQLFLIILIALTTCALIEEKLDDNVVLEKTIPRKTITNFGYNPIKGINGLFIGKVGEEFRKQKKEVKEAIIFFIKKNENVFHASKGNPGQIYYNPCPKRFSQEICRSANSFINEHHLG